MFSCNKYTRVRISFMDTFVDILNGKFTRSLLVRHVFVLLWYRRKGRLDKPFLFFSYNQIFVVSVHIDTHT